MIEPAIFFNEDAWKITWHQNFNKIERRCARCVYDDHTPGIIFDENGVCQYCKQHDQLTEQYMVTGERRFEEIVAAIKQEGKNKKYDVIVGVSGGCDSSYTMYLAKEHGLRPLAVHFDNTWNSTIAVENINNLLSSLNVELYTHVVDNKEYDDLYLAILRAGVSELDIPTDLALAAVLNKAAAKYGVRYIFEGHAFSTEGVAPLGWGYIDAKYVESMYKQFGSGMKLKTFPNLWLHKQLKWMLVNRLKKIRPLWYLPYNKPEVKKLLTEKFNWQWYGGHHLENQITAFCHSYLLPRRFNMDQRKNSFSALVRSNQMTRQEALEQLAEPPACNMNLVEMILKRWQLSEGQFIEYMIQPIKTFRNFKTYKPTFERWRLFFYVMAKMEFIPWSFYIKYTAKSPT